MPTMTIDGQEYDTDTFSDEAKAKMVSLQMVDAKIVNLNNEISIMQTARNAYAKAFADLLPNTKQ